MEQGLTAAEQQPKPTLEVLTLEVKFYLNQTAQNIIEVGKRLITAKEMLPHGDWGKWLRDNFQLSQNTANKFMNVAERFANYSTSNNLKPSQMVELLALPADEAEQFIVTKAAEGNPVEDMTVKQLREEIQQWKSKAEVNANAVNEKDRRISQLAFDFNNLQDKNTQLQRSLNDARSTNTDLLSQIKNQKPIIKAPDDYERIKRDLAKLRDEKFNLQKRLDAASREVKVPDDYHANKKKLAELDATIARMQKTIDAQSAEIQRRVTAEEYYATAQKLDAISALVNDIIFKKELGTVIEEYRRNKRDRFEQILALFSDFVRSYKN